MYLHLIPDHNLLDKFIELTGLVSNLKSHTFVIVHGSTPFSKPVQEKIKYENVLCCRQDLKELDQLVGGIQNYSKVYIHFLSDFLCDVISHFKTERTKFYWMFWGADLYLPTDYFKDIIYDKESLIYYEKHTTFQKTGSWYLDAFKYLKRKLPGGYFSKRSHIRRSKAIPLFDYFCHFSKPDYELVRKYYNLEAEFLPFFYFDINYDKLHINDLYELPELKEAKANGKNIVLIGHSASLTNNHLSIIDFLSKNPITNSVYLCPLSYGDLNYTNHVIAMGEKKLGNSFIALREYLKKPEYMNLLKHADISLMNHIRTEAAGNVFILLALNNRVWINEKSTLNFFLRSLGVKLLKKENLTEIFSNENLENNRRIVIETFNKEVGLKQVSSLYQ